MNIKDVFNGEYSEIKDLEILNTYPNSHGLDFSEEDLDNYAKNTNEIVDNNLLSPNFGISHSDQQLVLKELFKMADVDIQEELPNIGLLHNFRRDGKRIIADVKNVPSKLKDMIVGKKLFTSLSPELVKNWRETGKNIIRAVRLSNIPSMKHVTDVHMSEELSYRGELRIEDGGHKMGDENKNLDVAKIIDEKLEKHTEGIVSKFSELIGKITKKEDKKPDVKVKDENMVSLSEVQAMQENLTREFMAQLNDLKLKLIEKDKKQIELSEEVQKQKLSSKKETAEAICSKALSDGVPPVIINSLKPVLLSEFGEHVVKFSETVEDKEVQVEKSIVNIIKDLFKNCPKINLSEISVTSLSAPSEDKERAVKKRAEELISQGKSPHDAWTQAGVELL